MTERKFFIKENDELTKIFPKSAHDAKINYRLRIASKFYKFGQLNELT